MRPRARLPLVVPNWIEPLEGMLAGVPEFRGCALRPAKRSDEERLFVLHREAMRDYVVATWGWDEAWQRDYFARTYAPRRQALIVRSEKLIGRVCITRHWRWLFLRDIELIASE